ncbi:molybdopterin molybdotransferase MoeA [Haloplanus sp. C73]|uniref:molybdopterin molybdotransferase MoeA n=1 Tax=Haloplanus sp. C73 TaxID=3421641 RepID=UPI003EBBEF8E
MTPLTDPDAASRAAARIREAPSETAVPLDAIGGRRLAEAVVAPADRPAHDYATMDGFAVAAADTFPVCVRDRSLGPAADPFDHESGTATPIATGAPLPHGADAVVPREDARLTDGRLDDPGVEAGTHVVQRGSYCTAGETLFDAGTTLSPRDAALLRDIGRERVTVERPLSVGVVATGDEVATGVQPDRDSETVAGLLRRWGHDATLADPIPDDPSALGDRLTALASEHDVLVTSGGTSVGQRDHTVGALADLGTAVWRGVALRPGRPAACYRLDDAVAFALPGKPVAAYVATVTLLAPFFRGERTLSHRAATVDRDLSLPDAPLTYAIPVAVDGDTVSPVGTPGSGCELYDGRFRPGRVAACPRTLRGDGLLFRSAPLVAGERVEWIPFSTLEAP